MICLLVPFGHRTDTAAETGLLNSRSVISNPLRTRAGPGGSDSRTKSTRLGVEAAAAGLRSFAAARRRRLLGQKRRELRCDIGIDRADQSQAAAAK